jgi:hypothetical protein
METGLHVLFSSHISETRVADREYVPAQEINGVELNNTRTNMT